MGVGGGGVSLFHLKQQNPSQSSNHQFNEKCHAQKKQRYRHIFGMLDYACMDDHYSEILD